MPLPDLLRALLSAHGTSGYETVPAGLWRDAASAFADVRVDDMGNSYVTVAGTGDGLTLGVIGHVDEIGLIVTHIDDSGFLYFASVGGWDPQILVGQRVTLRVDDVDVERLSPLGTDHITLTGRYRIALPDALRDRDGYRELNTTPAVAA